MQKYDGLGDVPKFWCAVADSGDGAKNFSPPEHTADDTELSTRWKARSQSNGLVQQFCAVL